VLSPAFASTDELIALIADGQRGRVSRGQLRAAGVHRRSIDRRIASGHLIPLHPGVYAVGHTAEIELADETAAVLACGLAALLSHHSATTLWEIRTGQARPIHITLIDGRQTGRPHGVIVHRSRTVTELDIRVHKGLPVTSPARTLLDIAATLPDRDLERALGEALVRRLVTEGDLARVMRAAGGHPGVCRLMRLSAEYARVSVTESEAEERMLAVLRGAGLSPPKTRRYVLGYRVDFLWPEQRLVVEVDGYRFHSTPQAFERDRRRDAELKLAGYTVIRITWRWLTDEPDKVIASIATALALATARA
jgi:very-short-patch-repair endonuclease